MNGENPYAPPQVAELESRTVFSRRDWKVYAETLIARYGTTLPEVDLETGDREGAHHKIRLSPPTSIFGHLRTSRPETIHAFVTPRTRFARIRRKLQDLLFTLSIFGFAVTGAYPYSAVVLIAMFTTLGIWGFLDKPKLKIEISAKRGWLRVTGAHPVALAYLRSIATPSSTS